MKLEDEDVFLAGWKPKAEQGQLVVVTPMRAALEQELGRRVKPSVVYRLLERHHWRKVAPDTRHPKAQPLVQDEWKKNAARKAGDRVKRRECALASRSVDVPGRSPVWSHGQDSPLLVASSTAPNRVQRLRAAIHLRLWRRQSPARAIGLEFEREDEHDEHERVSAPGQPSPSGGVHRDGG